MNLRNNIHQVFFLIVLILYGMRLTSQENAIIQYQAIFSKITQAEQNKDYKKAVEGYQKMLEMSPHDGDTYYRMALVQSLLGEYKKSFVSFKTALTLGYDFGERLDSVFVPIREIDEFKTLQNLINKMQTPISTSDVAYILPEKDLIPEGIAYDSVEDCFYLSSCWKHKIVKLKRDGTTSAFTEKRQDGLRTVLGMRVDAKRRILWAASVITRKRPDMDIGQVGWSGLFKYDLKTGRLIKKYTICEDGVQHLFNDIAITSQGDVFVTDSEYQAIFTVHHDRDELELFLKPDCLFVKADALQS